MAAHLIDSSELLEIFIHVFPHESPRYERKFRVPSSDGKILFSHLINLGFSSAYKERRINSIYYDTKDYRFARENIDGERYRIKPRLRWYGINGLSDEINAFLEYKFRNGFLGYKYRKEITSPLSEYATIPSYIENEIFTAVFPVIKIDYDRVYLLHDSGIRATIDINIRAHDLSAGYNFNASAVGYDVIEFKYPTNLDSYFREYVFSMLSVMAPYRLNKSSKYVEGLLTSQMLFGEY